MWIGGYDDWTPAEQREWDRDLEEMQAEREQREREAKNEDKLSWMELALDYPKFKATYTRIGDTDLYVVDLKRQTPSKQGDRNLVFEVVYPLYQGLNAILEKRKTPQTSLIKIEASSREHVEVTYSCECTPDQWSYNIMDKISEALADQLTMKQNLDQGLLMKISFYEE